MNEKYEKYLTENWKKAEELSTKCGCSENRVVTAIFKLITQPYYYWVKENK